MRVQGHEGHREEGNVYVAGEPVELSFKGLTQRDDLSKAGSAWWYVSCTISSEESRSSKGDFEAFYEF